MRACERQDGVIGQDVLVLVGPFCHLQSQEAHGVLRALALLCLALLAGQEAVPTRSETTVKAWALHKPSRVRRETSATEPSQDTCCTLVQAPPARLWWPELNVGRWSKRKGPPVT